MSTTHTCSRVGDDGQPLAPLVVTCGECGRSWCERCDPAPSALCHWCNGRGHSIAPMENRRQEALRQLCDTWGLRIHDGQARRWASTAEEDIAAYFYEIDGEDPQPVDEWAAITEHDDESGIVYVKTYPTLQAAQEGAAEYVQDDIFSERPIRIVSLDTGRTFAPIIRVDWKEAAR